MFIIYRSYAIKFLYKGVTNTEKIQRIIRNNWLKSTNKFDTNGLNKHK